MLHNMMKYVVHIVECMKRCCVYALIWMALVWPLQTYELLLLFWSYKLSFPQMTVNYICRRYDLGLCTRAPTISSSLIATQGLCPSFFLRPAPNAAFIHNKNIILLLLAGDLEDSFSCALERDAHMNALSFPL